MAATALSAVVPVCVGAADLLWLGWAHPSRTALRTLRILVLSTGIQSLGAVAYMMLNGMGHPARAMVPTVIGASTNIFLGMFLGARWGLAGIALAVCCGFIVQTILLTRAMDRLLEMPRGFARTITPVVIAAATGIAAGTAVTSIASNAWLRLLLSSAVGLAASHGLLLLFGWYDKRELEFLWHALRSTTPYGAVEDDTNRGKE